MILNTIECSLWGESFIYEIYQPSPLKHTHTRRGAWNTWWQRTRNYRPWGENVHRRVSYCARPHVRHPPQLLWPSSLTGTYLTVKAYLQTFLYERYLLHFSFSSGTWIHGRGVALFCQVQNSSKLFTISTRHMGIVLTLHYFQWKLEEEVCRIHSFILVLHTRERMLATFFLPVYRKQTTLPTLFFFTVLRYREETLSFLCYAEVSKQWMFDLYCLLPL